MTTALFEGARSSVAPRSRLRSLRGGLQGSEYAWAIAFCIPYVGVFIAFVLFPVFYGLWLGHSPSLYIELFNDPIYQQTVVNTILYLVIGVNVKMFLALLLSGFFMRCPGQCRRCRPLSRSTGCSIRNGG
jgi:multiple sugar transport system permease protein